MDEMHINNHTSLSFSISTEKFSCSWSSSVIKTCSVLILQMQGIRTPWEGCVLLFCWMHLPLNPQSIKFSCGLALGKKTDCEGKRAACILVGIFQGTWKSWRQDPAEFWWKFHGHLLCSKPQQNLMGHDQGWVLLFWHVLLCKELVGLD